MASEVLIISRTFPPNWSAGALRIGGFARHLPEYGWKCHILTHGYDSTQSGSNAAAVGSEGVYRADALDYGSLEKAIYILLPKEGILRRLARWFMVPINRLINEYLLVPDRYVLWVFSGLMMGCRLLRNNRNVDCILTSSPPASLLIVGYVLARLFNKPHIIDFRDPWIVGAPLKRHSRLRRTIEEYMATVIIERSCLVITNTESQRQQLDARLGNRLSRNIVITNGVDLADEGEVVSSFPPCDDQGITILHAGHIYEDLRNPLSLLKAIGLLRSEHEELFNQLTLFFLGGGDFPTTQTFKDAVKTNGLGDVVVTHHRVPPTEARPWISRADVLLLMQNSPEASTQLPSKAFDYAATGKPILALAPKDSETERFVVGENLGIVATRDDPETIRDALVAVLSMRKDFQSSFDISKYSRRHLTQELARELDQVVSQHPPVVGG